MEKLIIGVPYFNALACDAAGGSWVKYHNIRNTPAALARFEGFLKRKFPHLHHVNYYDKQKVKGESGFMYQKPLQE